MKQFEVTFIVDPVLSGDDLKSTVSTYTDMIKNEGCKIIATDELGLKQLAYDIKKRSTGIYYTVEFQSENGLVIDKLELALRRDERIMRFLTVSLDKFGIKYNADKREGKIGKVKEKVKPEEPKPYSPPARSAPKPRPEPVQEAAPEATKAPEPAKAEEVAKAPEPVKTEEVAKTPEVAKAEEVAKAPEMVKAEEVTKAPEVAKDEEVVVNDTPESN